MPIRQSGSPAILGVDIATGEIQDLAVTTAKIAANAVTLAKMGTQNDQTVLGNVVGATAVPVALSAAQIATLLSGQTLNVAQLNVSATKVIGAQGAAIPSAGAGAVAQVSATSATLLQETVDLILARLRAHGIIAT